VPAVFIESTINPKLLNQLARDNKISIGGSLFADSLGDSANIASTYLGMLQYNTDVITASLSQSKSDIVLPTEGISSGISYFFGFFGFIAVCGCVVYFISKKNKI
jgi:hypothetical protein